MNDIRDSSRFLQGFPVADAVVRRQGSRANAEQSAGKRAGKPGKSRVFQEQVNGRLTLRSFFRHALFAVFFHGGIKLVVFPVGDHVEQRICVLRNDFLDALRSGLFRNRKKSALDSGLSERLRRAEKIVDAHLLCRRFNRALHGSERERLAKAVPFFKRFDRPSASRRKPHPDQRTGFSKSQRERVVCHRVADGRKELSLFAQVFHRLLASEGGEPCVCVSTGIRFRLSSSYEIDRGLRIRADIREGAAKRRHSLPELRRVIDLLIPLGKLTRVESRKQRLEILLCFLGIPGAVIFQEGCLLVAAHLRDGGNAVAHSIWIHYILAIRVLEKKSNVCSLAGKCRIASLLPVHFAFRDIERVALKLQNGLRALQIRNGLLCSLVLRFRHGEIRASRLVFRNEIRIRIGVRRYAQAVCDERGGRIAALRNLPVVCVDNLLLHRWRLREQSLVTALGTEKLLLEGRTRRKAGLQAFGKQRRVRVIRRFAPGAGFFFCLPSLFEVILDQSESHIICVIDPPRLVFVDLSLTLKLVRIFQRTIYL